MGILQRPSKALTIDEVYMFFGFRGIRFVVSVMTIGVAWFTASPALARTSYEDINPEGTSAYNVKKLVRAPHEMIATANPLASEVGRAILAKGGSAVDALIAAQLVLNLVEPQSSGIGGGAFMVHYEAATHELITYDGRETAPAAAKSDRFLRDGKPLSYKAAVNTGFAVATPGLLRGLALAHQDHGRLSWADLFTPAITLAENGFAVSPRLHAEIERAPELAQQAEAARYFFDTQGRAWPEGHVLRNPAFAAVLRRIASEGPNAFYEGEIARAIVAAVRAHPQPGDLTEADLMAYRALRREPICSLYRGLRVCGAPPPASGTVTVMQILGQLEPYPLERWGVESVMGVHYFSESGRLAFADRNVYLGDPDYVQVPVQAMLAPHYLRARAALIRPDRSMKEALPGDPSGLLAMRGADDALEVPSTTHLAVVDAQGNVASMTSTVESEFGSKIFVHGFVLNNEMTDFSLTPRDSQGRWVANRIEPGKRPRSSMAPLIIFDMGRPYLALGSPGGSAIINYVAKTVVGVVDGKRDIQQAIDMPNMGSRNQATELERGTRLEALAPALRALGHDVVIQDFPSGVQGIMITPQGLEGGADPRREGRVLGG